MSKKNRTIGISATVPKNVCSDKNCPWDGTLKVRGRIFEGKIVETRMNRTVVIRRDYLFLIRKYNRYETRKSKISAHQPGCIDLVVGDTVRAMECRPLSKSKSFVVIEVLQKQN